MFQTLEDLFHLTFQYGQIFLNDVPDLVEVDS